jgi:hypothetical protein
MVLSHITKILEKVIKNKIEDTNSKLLQTGDYQSGFKTNISTHKNLSIICNRILNARQKRKARKIYLTVDL